MANKVHTRLVELSAAHAALLKTAAKAKPENFRRVSSSKGGEKLEEGEVFTGVFLGTVHDGEYTNHRFACTDAKGAMTERLLKGVTVINQALEADGVEPGKTVFRIERTGEKKTKGKRTVFLYDIGVLE